MPIIALFKTGKLTGLKHVQLSGCSLDDKGLLLVRIYFVVIVHRRRCFCCCSARKYMFLLLHQMLAEKIDIGKALSSAHILSSTLLTGEAMAESLMAANPLRASPSGTMHSTNRFHLRSFDRSGSVQARGIDPSQHPFGQRIRFGFSSVIYIYDSSSVRSKDLISDRSDSVNPSPVRCDHGLVRYHIYIYIYI